MTQVAFDVDGIILRDENNPQVRVRQWWLGPYFHGGTTRDQSSFLDALVIATDYVGPRVSPGEGGADNATR